MIVIVMGVSGSGKSTLGRALAANRGWPFIEGDDFHPKANIRKMAAGVPLDDTDRLPWLQRLHVEIAAYSDRHESLVVACSALKKAYRQLLAEGVDDIRFAHLWGDPAIVRERLGHRQDHFMSADLLDSQINTLEPPADALLVPLDLTTNEQVALTLSALGRTA